MAVGGHCTATTLKTDLMVQNIEDREEKKRTVQMANSQFKERFQFILYLNDDVICQRYFRVNGFMQESLCSKELMETMKSIVEMLKGEFESKSRIYLWYTQSDTKINGFENPEEIEYLHIETEDEEKPEPYEYTFKFVFKADDEPIYECIWDGSLYPRFIRNSVDLTNSEVLYKNGEQQFGYTAFLTKKINAGRGDMVHKIIRKLCECLSAPFGKEVVYTKTLKYGDEEYPLALSQIKNTSKWNKYLREKTRDYFVRMYPSDKAIERYEKYY